MTSSTVPFARAVTSAWMSSSEMPLYIEAVLILSAEALPSSLPITRTSTPSKPRAAISRARGPER